MTDPVHETLGAVARSATAREENGRMAFEIVAAREYNTGAADLWDALTNPVRLEQWFLPVTGELQEGGNFQFEGNAGGEIRECAAPASLVVTWGMGEDTSLVSLKLEEVAADCTRLTLEHTGKVAPEFWEQYGPGAVGIGWDMALFGAAEHLLPEPAVTRANAETWMMSDEGKSFSRESGAAWGEAAIAGGDEPAAAERAAATVIGFYTGETAPDA